MRNYFLLILFFVLNFSLSFGQQQVVQDTVFYKGKVISIGERLGEQKTGLWSHFHYGGELKYTVNYNLDTPLIQYYNYITQEIWGTCQCNFDSALDKCIENGKSISYGVEDTKNVIFSEGNYCSGKACGKWIDYFQNGQILSITHFLEGQKDGKYIGYYLNGNIREEGNYKKEAKTGLWKEYYKNGNLKVSGSYYPKFEIFRHPQNYIDSVDLERFRKMEELGWSSIPGGSETYTKYMKDDTWNYYNEEGELIKTEEYSRGFLLEETKF